MWQHRRGENLACSIFEAVEQQSRFNLHLFTRLSLLSSSVRFIFGMLAIMVGLDLLWCLASLRIAQGTVARLAIAAFGFAQLAGLLWLLRERLAQPGSGFLPKFGFSILFIWHMIVLPVILLGGAVFLLIATAIGSVALTRRWFASEKNDAPPQPASRDRFQHWSRRQFLTAAIAAAPPLLNIGLAAIAVRQLEQFRTRRFILPIPELPRELHGLTIAQVSDMHVGRFTSGAVLREIVRVVNDLRVDLVLLTGDLINDALADLDGALELVRTMQARSGVYLIEGNHDLIENPAEFEGRVKRSGIPFLLDQSTIVTIRGAPLQLLGLSWTRTRENRDAAIASSVRKLMRQRQSDAFAILLAHHPHAFDAAAEAKIPVTLSGHTHGGQLMLNEQCGFGPALFRYWSGLYTRGASKLIVSNGVGNWFPLRIRAPAELVHITMRRA
jgi:predicted MPP superfamily phosphohydrolase